MRNRRARTVFVASHHRLFQVPASVLCNSVGVTNIQDFFVEVQARWPTARKILDASPEFVGTVDILGARVQKYSDDALGCNQGYNNFVPSRMGLAIGAEDMRVVMLERTGATWEQS